MNEPTVTALDHRSAVALLAAAAGSVSSAEAPNTAAWERVVGERAAVLLRLVPGLVERSAILAACKPVTGILAGVEEVKGRGVLTSHATMGTPQRGQEVVGGRGVEHFRTGFLNTAEGKAMYELAQSLVGHHCRFSKWVDEYTDAHGQAAKVSMCAGIEDLGADQGANGAGTGNGARPAQRPAQGRQEARSDPGAAPGGDWFADHGWDHQAAHDKARAALVAEVEAAPAVVRATVMRWVKDKGLDWSKAWPAEPTMVVKAKLAALVAEALQPVGAGAVEYEPGDEPF